MGRSNKISKHTIEKDTTLEDIVAKLQEDKNSVASSANQHPIYIKEDFNLAETDDRTRVELRSFIKHLQRQKLLSDSDFICFTHWARFDDSRSTSEILSKLKACRSELDRITVIKKRFLKCRAQLSKEITIEGAAQVK